jgi:hypothetical protein
MSTSITLRSIADILRDTIVADTALNTYCTGTLGKALTTQVGSNQGQPLGASDAPYCAIVTVSKAVGDVDQFAWEFDLGFGIEDSVFSDYQSKGAKEMRGQYRIEEFGDYIMAAVAGIDNNLTIATQNTQISSAAFPLHTGLHNLTLTTLNVIGGTIGL